MRARRVTFLVFASGALLWIGTSISGPDQVAHAQIIEPREDCGELPLAQGTYHPDPRVATTKVGGRTIRVLLPTGYRDSEHSYPVLYLLHGFTQTQDSWLNFTDIEEFTEPFTGHRAAIVVIPRVPGDGLVVDFRNGKRKWETYFIRELIPTIEERFRTFGDRSHRAIAGLSGGGFGATHLAARHPDLFAAVGTFSGVADLTYQSPRTELTFLGLIYAAQLDCGSSPGDEGIFGDPITDSAWWHNANPADMAPNFGGLSVYVASGNGLPCDERDVADMLDQADPNHPEPYTMLEPLAYEIARSFSRKLREAGIAHRIVLGCGLHTWPNWERDLHRFWPQMVRAFGSPAPQSFDYRTVEPSFSVWRWRFAADLKRAAEFLEITDASKRGLTLTGSGTETVRTARYFRPGERLGLRGAVEPSVRADRRGRITFHVDLGPPHPDQQYSVEARLAGQGEPGYFTTRRVRFSP